jgi:uncharacterized protein (TIGR02145 family)
MNPIAGNVGNDQASNNSRFNAVPSGARNRSDGFFINLRDWTIWWTGSPDNENANLRYLQYDINSVYVTVHLRNTGEAVRCLQN